MGSTSTQATTFLDLPAEIRVRIYKLVYVEIEVCCDHPCHWYDGGVDGVGRWILPGPTPEYFYTAKYSSALLLASRQVYSEAKAVLTNAPITVASREGARFRLCDFPADWNLFLRVKEVIVPASGQELLETLIRGPRT